MRAGVQDRSGLLAAEGEEAQEEGQVAFTSVAARPSRKRWPSVAAGSVAALGVVMCLLLAHVPGPEHARRETASRFASLAGAAGARENESQQAQAQLAPPVHKEAPSNQSTASSPTLSSAPASTQASTGTCSEAGFFDSIKNKIGGMFAAVSRFFQSLFKKATQWVPGSCSGIEATHHYPLPGTTYTDGLPSPLVAHPSGMTLCDVENLQHDCVEQINVFRAGAPFSDGRCRDHGYLEPLKIGPEDYRKCMNEKASSDLFFSDHKGQGCGHHTFGLKCDLDQWWGAENSCCTRRCESYDDCKEALFGCLQSMWDEGQIVLDTGSGWSHSTGHYYNMIGDGEYVACGFGFDSEGRMVATQNF